MEILCVLMRDSKMKSFVSYLTHQWDLLSRHTRFFAFNVIKFSFSTVFLSDTHTHTRPLSSPMVRWKKPQANTNLDFKSRRNKHTDEHLNTQNPPRQTTPSYGEVSSSHKSSAAVCFPSYSYIRYIQQDLILFIKATNQYYIHTLRSGL